MIRSILSACVITAFAAITQPHARASAQTQADSNSAHAASAENSAGVPAAPIPTDPAFNERARSVNNQLRCPVCQGISIQESPSAEATAMKEIVRQRLAAGQSEDQIKAYFVEKYGEWILMEPPAHGLNLVVYLLPILLLIGGGYFVYRTARRWTTGPA